MARKLDWEFSYTTEREVFSQVISGCPWLPHSRHRQWSQALTQTAIEDTPNRELIQTWINKWHPGALRAADAFSPLFEGKPAGPGMPPFRDLTSQVMACSAEYLRTMGLQAGPLNDAN